MGVQEIFQRNGCDPCVVKDRFDEALNLARFIYACAMERMAKAKNDRSWLTPDSRACGHRDMIIAVESLDIDGRHEGDRGNSSRPPSVLTQVKREFCNLSTCSIVPHRRS